jgi:hypothetical protein
MNGLVERRNFNVSLIHGVMYRHITPGCDRCGSVGRCGAKMHPMSYRYRKWNQLPIHTMTELQMGRRAPHKDFRPLLVLRLYRIPQAPRLTMIPSNEAGCCSHSADSATAAAMSTLTGGMNAPDEPSHRPYPPRAEHSAGCIGMFRSQRVAHSGHAK